MAAAAGSLTFKSPYRTPFIGRLRPLIEASTKNDFLRVGSMQPGENQRLISLRHRSGAKGSRSVTWFDRSEHFARPQFMVAIRLLMHQSKPVLDRNSSSGSRRMLECKLQEPAANGSDYIRLLQQQ